MSRSITRRRFLAASAGSFSLFAAGGAAFWFTGLGRRVARADDGLSYVAVAPRTLRIGGTENIAVSLAQGDAPASGAVNVALLKDGQTVATASGNITGKGSVPLSVPATAEGEYDLQVSGDGFGNSAKVQLESSLLVFVETDKPIYKPGQDVKIRVVTLDPDLRPTAAETTVEVADAKGIKVFKRAATADEWGMVSLTLPLSAEPNLGTWKIRATSGKRTGQVDVRVERYTLPKYEVKVELAREWALASDPISGTIAAEYSYGKPVQGEAEIVAQRYVGTWQEYARVTRQIDGRVAFEVPAVGYAAGSPAGGGNASVRLDVTVREPATGYEEKTNRLVTIATSPINVRVIPESQVFKPQLPLSLLVIAETPDKQPTDADVTLKLTYQAENFTPLKEETKSAAVRGGAMLLEVTPPAGAASLTIAGSANGGPSTVLQARLQAGYSPSGSFIHLEQLSRGDLKVGDTAKFRVRATREASTFYYEVLARGKVVYSDFSRSPEFDVPLTPLMAPGAKVLVYQLLPNAEVAADYLPIKVSGSYPHNVQLSFERDEVAPGDGLSVSVQTEGRAKVGLAAVDRSVFILAENRLNLQQVFDELERLYLKPQAELHDAEPVGGGVPGPRPAVGVAVAPPVAAMPVQAAPAQQFVGPNANFIPGAKEIFQDAGVVVLTNRQVPAGKQLQDPRRFAVPMAAAGAVPAPVPTNAPGAPPALQDNTAGGLAEVQRVRQFFPETWFWDELTTDDAGKVSKRIEAPDSITTWMGRAVALSKEKGFGVSEAQVRVFQPFFVSVDLPYSAIRGEQFPAKIALYNYTADPQTFQVDLDAADWFELLDAPTKSVDVAPNGVGGVAFTIRPRTLGIGALKVTARSRGSADAVIKELPVEPEGVAREVVENLVLSPGRKTVDLAVPANAVAGSGRALIALTGNVLSQTMEGLEKLLQMPFGCGEQNMILFAPNVFITRYLKETGQLKVEIMAKADKLMLTGYQRELTYRRNDNSFSAFGNSDKEGSLWLTAFVLKTFAQAKDIMFIDNSVQAGSRDWILSHQNGDGSFDPVGFLHHQDLMGGLKGKAALTAYVAIALREAGRADAANRALRYLEGQLDGNNDTYATAITAYALTLGQSARAADAVAKLMTLAKESDEGLYWPGGPIQPVAQGVRGPGRPQGIVPPPEHVSAAVETTAYGALALLESGDKLGAGRAIRWLASKRNASGGFGSTQDTVVALQAMASAAASSRADIDATVTLSAGSFNKQVRLDPSNADVLQIVEAPAGGPLELQIEGRGQVTAQAVTRFNLPKPSGTDQPVFQIDVRYSTEQVAVNDTITISASVLFQPPIELTSGMVVLDLSIPTGFAHVPESLDALLKQKPKIKRWDAAGRKVIFYIEDMSSGERLDLSFQAKALYPVRAQPVASTAYSYYKPEWSGEHLGAAVTVGE